MEAVQGVFVAGVMVVAMFVMVRGVTKVRPSSGGISASGKALRFLMWRAPVGAARYTTAKQLALLTAEGRMWAALFGFGVWVAFLVWVSWTINAFEGFTAFLGLLWIVFFFRLLTRASKRRSEMKQRLRYEQLLLAGQQRLLAQLGSLVTQAGGGGFTMLGSARRLDPNERTRRDMESEAAEAVREQTKETYTEEELRDLLGPQYGMATGQPGEKIPRWMRRLLK